jgi:FkbM family methyltransferase
MKSNFQLLEHESGLYIRQGIAADPYVISEIPTYEKFVVGPGDTVLDLGANIGALSHRFLTDGAELVIAVEPFPSNVEMLRKNLEQFSAARYEIIEAAVVGPNTGEYLDLHTPDTNFGMISRARHNVPYAELTGTLNVITVQFDGLLDRYHPTAIKCDIEGGEWDFAERLMNLPETVRTIAIELHNFHEHIEDPSHHTLELYDDLTLALGSQFHFLGSSGVFLTNEHSAKLVIYSR